MSEDLHGDPLDDVLAEVQEQLGGPAARVLGCNDLAQLEPRSAAERAEVEVPARACLKIFEPGEDTRGREPPQCLDSSAFVCMDEDGLQWFACQTHADEHAFVRIPLQLFFHYCRTSRRGIPREAWTLSPKAPPDLCLTTVTQGGN